MNPFANALTAAMAAGLLLFSPLSRAACEPYFVESNQGKGGFRLMHDPGKFRQIGSGKRFDGKVCDRSSIKVELAKMKPKTELRFHIGGKAYEFKSGDKGDKQANNWYRKYIKIKF